MQRADLSKNLVHWTRGESYEEAFAALWSIVHENRLRGGLDARRGGHPSVCFTEAPSDLFKENPRRYRPFGITVSKRYMFDMGARPVIYQTEAEFNDLPECMQWRHVRYEPHIDRPIDFTWEREWRYYGWHLDISPQHWTVIVPDEEWREYLLDCHDQKEQLQAALVEESLGNRYYCEKPFPYAIQVMPEAAGW